MNSDTVGDYLLSHSLFLISLIDGILLCFPVNMCLSIPGDLFLLNVVSSSLYDGLHSVSEFH